MKIKFEIELEVDALDGIPCEVTAELAALRRAIGALQQSLTEGE